MELKALVFAGDYYQYKTWLSLNKLKRQEYLFVYEPNHIQGFHNIPVKLVGTHQNNGALKYALKYKRLIHTKEGESILI